MNMPNLGSRESLWVKFKNRICAKLCLELWFKSDWHFCNITDSGAKYSQAKFKTITS